MKKNISYLIGGICLMAGATVFTGCQDDFDNPVIEAPVATLQPNMTIFELKQMYWDDATNYIDTIGIENGQDDGKSYVIHGRVVSSDEAGNVFKSLIIQDETAALALSINSYNLYLKYRMGQEVVLDLKGMYIGKYNGLVQLGMPEWYEAGNAWEATFMAPEFFEQHVQLNGFPDIAKVDTLEINSFSDLPSNPDGLCRYQSRLVKFNNVSFQNGGEQQFSEYHSSGVNQNIVDANGATLPVRTSGYSNFWNKYLPKGNGDVVCILSYYGSTGWQLMLNDYEGCMNFGNPTLSPGAESNPYTVAEAVSAIAEGKTRSGWVSGYIVGAVAPEVAEVTGNDDIEWSADVVLDNTLVIGATPDTKDISQALVISLPAGSLLRQYGNLADNPDNYKKAISVKGTFGKYMGTYGVLDNSGSASQFKIEGVEVVDPSVGGSGTETAPYTVADVIGGATGTDVWTKGYIVGWVDGMTLSSGATFNADATANTNILLAASPDVTDVGQCLPVQLPGGAVRSALNLQDNPGNYKRAVMLKGSLEKYFGAPGIKTVTAYTFDGEVPDNPGTPDTPSGEAKGSGTASDPYNVAKALQVAVANGETSDVSVYTEGYVISGSIDTQYGNGTWVIADNAAGTGSTITVYRAKDFNNEKFTDANKVKVGDKIVVYAPIINYKGNTPETNYGYLYSINGNTSGGSTTPDTPDQPDQPGDVTGAGTEASPYTVADVQNGATGTAWVKGYIVGWVDGMTLSSGATFNADATAATNLLIADSPDVTDAGKCVPVQLPAGDVRTALNLQDNPGNYKKCVLLQGSLERYFGTAGVKSVKSYKFVD